MKKKIIIFISLIFLFLSPYVIFAHVNAIAPSNAQVFTGGAQQVDISWDYYSENINPESMTNVTVLITQSGKGVVDSIWQIPNYPFKTYKTKVLQPGTYSWRVEVSFVYPSELSLIGHWADTGDRYFTIEEPPAPSIQNEILSTSFDLAAKPRTVNFGKTTILSGQLKDSNGQLVAYKQIIIKGKVIEKKRKKAKGKIIFVSKASWKKLAVVITDKNGKFSFKHKPKETTVYKAEFAGDSSYKSSETKEVKVTVTKSKSKKKAKKK